MTFFVKCDNCGKMLEANDNGNYPSNPFDEETKQKWYSRTKDGKTVHACCREHCEDKALIWPAGC